MVLLSDRAKLTAELVAVVALIPVDTVALVTLGIPSKRLLMDAFGLAKPTESFSIVEVVKLYFSQIRRQFLDVRIILLNKGWVVFEGATHLLVLDLALVVLVLASRDHLIAEVALDLEALALNSQMLFQFQEIHFVFIAMHAAKKVLPANFHMFLKVKQIVGFQSFWNQLKLIRDRVLWFGDFIYLNIYFFFEGNRRLRLKLRWFQILIRLTGNMRRFLYLIRLLSFRVNNGLKLLHPFLILWMTQLRIERLFCGLIKHQFLEIVNTRML